jgi:small conductance mechanosensitive channel
MDTEQLNTLISEIAPLASTWVLRVAGAIVGFLVARIAAGWAAAAFERAAGRAKLEETLLRFGSNIVRWGILLIACVAILGIFGVETTSFAAAIGAMGLAVGLAFQGSLGNVASGVMLLIFRPFKVGDVIRVAGEVGKVSAIELMVTTLNTPDNRRIIVPNSSVFGSTLENLTFHDGRRVDVDVGVAYDADLDKTREVLMKAIADVPNQTPDLAPMVYLVSLGASSVDYSVRVFVDQEDYWTAREQLTIACKKRLDEAGIGIPFPQLDLHLDDDAVAHLAKAA